MENKGNKQFFVKKVTGTYSETLEAYGLANLLRDIFINNEKKGISIDIDDKGTSYQITTSKEVTNDLIRGTKYFQVVKFIKKKVTDSLPQGVSNFFDYPEQSEIRTKHFEARNTILKEKKENWRNILKKIDEEFRGEFGEKIDYEYDVYREIQKNPYKSFLKSFHNFHKNKDHFHALLGVIIAHYTHLEITLDKKIKIDKKITSMQLYGPSQSQGLNRKKANGLSRDNISSLWFKELLKIKGALELMRVRRFSVGKKWDNKIFVPDFKHIQLNKIRIISREFKLFTSGSSSIKIDILGLLKFCELLIKESPEYRGKIKNCVSGFHSVYQKQMNSDSSKPKSVMNISFLCTPSFISYYNKEESRSWIKFLKRQQKIISKIEEQGDAAKNLKYFRDFLGTGNAKDFYNFSYWYAGYLMRQLAKDKKNKFKFKRFEIDSLNKIFKSMDEKFSNIIENEGLLSIANAIRNSTVRLQYSQSKPKYKVRYGFAQQLKTKAKSATTLKSFVGDFIGTYNAETARMYEKAKTTYGRERITDEQINQFFSLFEFHTSQEIGAMLASYGFAKKKFEEEEDVLLRIQEEAAKLGYELVKMEDETEIENIIIEPELD